MPYPKDKTWQKNHCFWGKWGVFHPLGVGSSDLDYRHAQKIALSSRSNREEEEHVVLVAKLKKVLFGGNLKAGKREKATFLTKPKFSLSLSL